MGTVGYCFGGSMALRAAAHHPDRIRTAASVHGGNLAVAGDPDTPTHDAAADQRHRDAVADLFTAHLTRQPDHGTTT